MSRDIDMKKKNHLNKNSGFTLLEVLVAMLVIAIGVLGVAGLQYQALKYNHDAYLRSQINVLANDIIDRIRLNSANADLYISNFAIGNAPGTCAVGTASDVNNDLACWYSALNTALPPGGNAIIAADGDVYEVSISWVSRDSANPTTVAYTFSE